MKLILQTPPLSKSFKSAQAAPVRGRRSIQDCWYTVGRSAMARKSSSRMAAASVPPCGHSARSRAWRGARTSASMNSRCCSARFVPVAAELDDTLRQRGQDRAARHRTSLVTLLIVAYADAVYNDVTLLARAYWLPSLVLCADLVAVAMSRLAVSHRVRRTAAFTSATTSPTRRRRSRGPVKGWPIPAGSRVNLKIDPACGLPWVSIEDRARRAGPREHGRQAARSVRDRLAGRRVGRRARPRPRRRRRRA